MAQPIAMQGAGRHIGRPFVIEPAGRSLALTRYEKVVLKVDRLHAQQPGMALPAEILEEATSLPADAAILTALLRLGDPGSLHAYLGAPSISAQIVSRVDRVRRSAEFDHTHRDCFSRGRIDLLEILLGAGISTHAIQAELPRLLSRPGAEASFAWLCNHDDIHHAFASLIDLIERCGDTVCESYAPILARSLEERRILISAQHLQDAAFSAAPKIFLVLVRAGPCQAALANALSLGPESTCPARRAWHKLALSNHGRLEMMMREPSLAKMIARP